MNKKLEYESSQTNDYAQEKAQNGDALSLKYVDPENSTVEAVRLIVPLTDNTALVALTFRFWILSFFFAALASIVNQYYYFRISRGGFPLYFVNLTSYALGVGLAKVLPKDNFSIGGYTMSLNPGPFNIKEHALIGIAVSTASVTAYAIDIITAMDLFLQHRMGALGAIVLIITTQCLGYGMAGVLRKYLVYPAEMVWWNNLVHVVFYNAIHNTDEFKTKRMVRGWSYMKFFWIICGGTFLYEFLPQFIAPLLLFFDWVCWLNPFNKDYWAMFSSMAGGGVGIMSLSFDWTVIGGYTLWIPATTQFNQFGGIFLSYWIILPILWMNNIMGTRTFGRPLTPRLFHSDGTPFDITPYLNDDFSLNDDKYNASAPVTMTPMYALTFMYSFIALAGCISHITCFHGADIWKTWKRSRNSADEDVHVKMMQVYLEVPQLWYAVFYVIMVGLSCMVCEVYGLQLPWWGLLVGLAMGWILTFPICAMTAIMGSGPGVNVITELVCGFMFPGKPLANMTFKCYGYMATWQCKELLSDLKLGVYLKIPPRSMLAAQLWGTLVGGVFNYVTMLLIIDAHRSYLDGTMNDPSGLWTGMGAQVLWGSALIYGALGPQRMFNSKGNYHFIYWGFLIGAVVPIIQWCLSKKYPKIRWSLFNVTIFASGMCAFPGGIIVGLVPSFVVFLIWQVWLFRYYKNVWSKYTFILSAALDTGAALTGLAIFIFLSGGVSSKLSAVFPSWIANYYLPDGSNAPYLGVNRCGAFNDTWTGGIYD
ncbi:hypothetical protein BGZ95_001992 [Linnemannia exigua]|uniref:OPT superfamily oligopeptide transporter n=1 Tax=Linnemannia exigua TaxID=604196 RepID=A0AAD4H9J5_9FUNG|nr:hypothetical protein BGZ95_001992 [Linnemannia exigua]